MLQGAHFEAQNLMNGHLATQTRCCEVFAGLCLSQEMADVHSQITKSGEIQAEYLDVHPSSV
jgi:hypothetical protein